MWDQLLNFLYNLSYVELGLFFLVIGALLFWLYLYISEYSGIKKETIAKIFVKKQRKDVKKELLGNFLKKTNSIKNKMEHGQRMMKSLSLFTKEFFGKWYSIDYRFTIPELIEEIKKTSPKIQKDIVLFLVKLGDKSFDPNITREEAVRLTKKSQTLARKMYQVEKGKVQKMPKILNWILKIKGFPRIKSLKLVGKWQSFRQIIKSIRLGPLLLLILALFVLFVQPSLQVAVPAGGAGSWWVYIVLLAPMLSILVLILLVSFFYYKYKQAMESGKGYVSQLRKARQLLMKTQKSKETKKKLRKLEKQKKLLELAHKNKYIRDKTYKKYRDKIKTVESDLEQDLE